MPNGSIVGVTPTPAVGAVAAKDWIIFSAVSESLCGSLEVTSLMTCSYYDRRRRLIKFSSNRFGSRLVILMVSWEFNMRKVSIRLLKTRFRAECGD